MTIYAYPLVWANSFCQEATLHRDMEELYISILMYLYKQQMVEAPIDDSGYFEEFVSAELRDVNKIIQKILKHRKDHF